MAPISLRMCNRKTPDVAVPTGGEMQNRRFLVRQDKSGSLGEEASMLP
jgi:hypothetical protein